MIGVDTAEGCDLQPAAVRRSGPGYIHFPISSAFDKNLFRATHIGERVQTRYKEGRPYRVWVLPHGPANEALDTMVYALAGETKIRGLPAASKPPQAAATPAGGRGRGSAGHAIARSIGCAGVASLSAVAEK